MLSAFSSANRQTCYQAHGEAKKLLSWSVCNLNVTYGWRLRDVAERTVKWDDSQAPNWGCDFCKRWCLASGPGQWECEGFGHNPQRFLWKWVSWERRCLRLLAIWKKFCWESEEEQKAWQTVCNREAASAESQAWWRHNHYADQEVQTRQRVLCIKLCCKEPGLFSPQTLAAQIPFHAYEHIVPKLDISYIFFRMQFLEMAAIRCQQPFAALLAWWNTVFFFILLLDSKSFFFPDDGCHFIPHKPPILATPNGSHLHAYLKSGKKSKCMLLYVGILALFQ